MTYGRSDRPQFLRDRVDPDANLIDEDGNLERPLSLDGWYTSAPSLTVRDGQLCVDRRLFSRSPSYVTPAAGILEQFIGLAEAADPERAVLEYAQRWGMLDLCVHQLPHEHAQEGLPISFATNGGVVLTFDSEVTCRWLVGREPIATWLYWSRQAAALLAVLSRLRGGMPARGEDWVTLGKVGPWAVSEPRAVDLHDDADRFVSRLRDGAPLSLQQKAVSGAVETWLRLGGVGFRLVWRHDLPEISTRGAGLFASLGFQMLLAAVNSSGWLVCRGCGSLHAPPKGPGPRPVYCSTCRQENLPQRAASKRSRSKKADDPAYREAERARSEQNRKRKRTTSTVGGPGE